MARDLTKVGEVISSGIKPDQHRDKPRHYSGIDVASRLICELGNLAGGRSDLFAVTYEAVLMALIPRI